MEAECQQGRFHLVTLSYTGPTTRFEAQTVGNAGSRGTHLQNGRSWGVSQQSQYPTFLTAQVPALTCESGTHSLVEVAVWATEPSLPRDASMGSRAAFPSPKANCTRDLMQPLDASLPLKETSISYHLLAVDCFPSKRNKDIKTFTELTKRCVKKLKGTHSHAKIIHTIKVTKGLMRA